MSQWLDWRLSLLAKRQLKKKKKQYQQACISTDYRKMSHGFLEKKNNIASKYPNWI